MRCFKGNRTRVFGAIIGILGLVELYDDEIVKQMIPAGYQGLVLLGVGIVVVILRQITTTPPGEKA